MLSRTRTQTNGLVIHTWRWVLNIAVIKTPVSFTFDVRQLNVVIDAVLSNQSALLSPRPTQCLHSFYISAGPPSTLSPALLTQRNPRSIGESCKQPVHGYYHPWDKTSVCLQSKPTSSFKQNTESADLCFGPFTPAFQPLLVDRQAGKIVGCRCRKDTPTCLPFPKKGIHAHTYVYTHTDARAYTPVMVHCPSSVCSSAACRNTLDLSELCLTSACFLTFLLFLLISSPSTLWCTCVHNPRFQFCIQPLIGHRKWSRLVDHSHVSQVTRHLSFFLSLSVSTWWKVSSLVL